tara:strand:+ start:771 stop:1115 length:345 start_codon:yes stop_codon:yes gene_type:complete
MIEKTGFNLTTVSRSPYHRGFQMTMTNGYTVSVQFGPGSISSVKNFSLDEPISLDTIDEKVENAEVMVFAPDGTAVPFKSNGEITKGHVSPDELVGILTWVMRREVENESTDKT